MIRRIGPVESAAATRTVTDDRAAYRPIDDAVTGGIAVVATEPELLADDRRHHRRRPLPRRRHGRLPDRRARIGGGGRGSASTRSTATRWCGSAGAGSRSSASSTRSPLAADIDRAALIGYPVAEELFGIDAAPSTVRVRTDPDQVEAVRVVLGATANPRSPRGVGDPALRRPGGQGRRPTRRSPRCCSGSARSPSSSAASASPTCWSSRCSSGATRSASAGPSAPPGATSGRSSSSRPCSSPRSAGPSASSSAPSPPVYADARGWSLAVPLAALAGGVRRRPRRRRPRRALPGGPGRPPRPRRRRPLGVARRRSLPNLRRIRSAGRPSAARTRHGPPRRRAWARARRTSPRMRSGSVR